MRKLLAVVSVFVVGACGANPAPAGAPLSAARMCVKNEGFALISVHFRQRDVLPVSFRSIAPGRTECRRVALGNASGVLFVDSDDQRDETIDVGLVRPGETIAVTVPRNIAQTHIM